MASGKARSKPAPRSGQRARATPPPTPPPAPPSSAFLGAGLVIGLYAMVPAFFTGGIHLRRGVEVVDHFIPGMLVLALVVAAIAWGARSESLMLGAGVGVVLAGFWMVATHVGLARQALNNEAGKAGALYHCSTAAAVAALGVAWVWRYRAAGATTPA
ncbi:MAG: hypothetical protein M3083_10910 [Actinomycetota bacterium]|nr:hypothetical protein [Actinomycetota bacterium]